MTDLPRQKTDLFHSYLACQFWCTLTKRLICAELVFDPHGINESSVSSLPVRQSGSFGMLYARAVDEAEPLTHSEMLLCKETHIKRCVTSGGGMQTSLPADRTVLIQSPERRVVLVLESAAECDDFLLDAKQYLSVCLTQSDTGQKATSFEPFRSSLFNNRCRVTLYRKHGWNDLVWQCKNMTQLVLRRDAFLYFQPHRARRGGMIYCCDIREDWPPFQTPIPETLMNVNEIHELCFGQHFQEFQTMAGLDKTAGQCFTLVQNDGAHLHVSLGDELSCLTLLRHLTDYYSEDLCKKIQT